MYDLLLFLKENLSWILSKQKLGACPNLRC